MKNLKITSSKPPTEAQIIASITGDATDTAVLARRVLEMYAPNAELGVVFKSTVPKNKAKSYQPDTGLLAGPKIRQGHEP